MRQKCGYGDHQWSIHDMIRNVACDLHRNVLHDSKFSWHKFPLPISVSILGKLALRYSGDLCAPTPVIRVFVVNLEGRGLHPEVRSGVDMIYPRPARATRLGTLRTCSGWGRTFIPENGKRGSGRSRRPGIAERRMEGTSVCEAELIAIAISSKIEEATVAERLDCSPPTRANRAQSPAGSLLDFRKWESCRTMPLVGGFSRGYPCPPTLHSALLHSNFISHSSVLKTSLRGTQLSRLNSDQKAWRKYGDTRKEHDRQPSGCSRVTPPRQDPDVLGHGDTLDDTSSRYILRISICLLTEAGIMIRSRIEFRTTMVQPGIRQVNMPATTLNTPVRNAKLTSDWHSKNFNLALWKCSLQSVSGVPRCEAICRRMCRTLLGTALTGNIIEGSESDLGKGPLRAAGSVIGGQEPSGRSCDVDGGNFEASDRSPFILHP
ncbi:hypothetical protein PR048_002522 [Dryococelus australis]|uniref:Uncharacterized protein n=1 Tax=Dryococelus australis TaxID=614101 RepID=A0ABQ9IKI6_9NEOP|nr:hypothetical protein PR048_002522 [Dryococelus australis]